MWVVLDKTTAQSVRIICVIRQSPLTESVIREECCYQSPLEHSCCSEHHSSGVSGGQQIKLCCCPGRTGQWSYPGFRGKSNTKRRKLFSQDHLSGVDSVLCSPCLLSTGIELQVCQRTLNLLVSFLKMLTWKGHGLKAYQNNSCWFLLRAFYSRSYALGLCPNLFWSTGLWGGSVRGNQAGSWLSPSASAAWEEGLIQQADWKSLWDTKQMLPFIDSGGVSSSLCKSGQVECSPANGSCRAEISCLPFQKEKHTELYGARHSTFMSQHINLENVSAEMFMAAYSFCLHFWDSSSECWESSCC